MQNNFQSLSYFLPEITIVLTILFTIISDLIKDLKKYTHKLVLFGLGLTGILLFLDSSTSVSRYLFNNMLISVLLLKGNFLSASENAEINSLCDWAVFFIIQLNHAIHHLAITFKKKDKFPKNPKLKLR